MTDEAVSIYDQFDPPKALPYVGTAIGLGVFIGTAHFANNSAPFFAAVSVGVISTIIGFTWPLRRRWLLWLLVTAITAVHVAALVLVKFPTEVSYGILFAPFVGIDIYFSWRAIVWVLRKSDALNGR